MAETGDGTLSDSVEFRQATADDADTLADVYRSAYRGNRQLGFPAKAESATTETVSAWIRDSQVSVAERQGDVVGGVRLERENPGRVHLSRFAVHEEWKGEGIGSGLLAHVEDEMQRQGVRTVWLTTPEEHPYLPDFYRSRGYRRAGDWPLDYREYDEIVMEKQLD